MKITNLIFICLTLSVIGCKAQQPTTSVPTNNEPKPVLTTTTDEIETPTAEVENTEKERTTEVPVSTAANGNIKGKVIYEGGQVRNVLNVIKDENTCGTGDLIDESLLTDENGGLNWAVVSISSEIKNGKGLDQLPSERILDQTTCVYQPHVVLIGVGEELTINNMDHTLHNVRTNSFMNDTYNKVQIYMPNMPHPSDKTTFTEPEVVEVVCDVHGWMKSYVHVVEHAYNVVTNSDGSFELTDVPPGKYTLKVWHEKLGEMEKEVEVTAGETTETDFSYKKLY